MYKISITVSIDNNFQIYNVIKSPKYFDDWLIIEKIYNYTDFEKDYIEPKKLIEILKLYNDNNTELGINEINTITEKYNKMFDDKTNAYETTRILNQGNKIVYFTINNKETKKRKNYNYNYTFFTEKYFKKILLLKNIRMALNLNIHHTNKINKILNEKIVISEINNMIIDFKDIYYKIEHIIYQNLNYEKFIYEIKNTISDHLNKIYKNDWLLIKYDNFCVISNYSKTYNIKIKKNKDKDYNNNRENKNDENNNEEKYFENIIKYEDLNKNNLKESIDDNENYFYDYDEEIQKQIIKKGENKNKYREDNKKE